MYVSPVFNFNKREKTKKYEENRKARKFNVKWLTNREWLDYDESKKRSKDKDLKCQLLKSPYQYFKNRNGIFRELKLSLR
jgi:predicted transcriptional regulator